MTLLPKSSEAASISDYRPISLIHIVGKLISKLLANRLVPKWDPLCISLKVLFLRVVIFMKVSDLCDHLPGCFTPAESIQLCLKLI
jgi:hypothetical protein